MSAALVTSSQPSFNAYSSQDSVRIDAHDDGLSAFISVRPRLFGIAYRMVGSMAEAEDIVQDVWIRWQMTDRSPIRSPLAFLVTATTRMAINVLHSARSRHETSDGSFPPEPADTTSDPGAHAERREILSDAVRLLFERLSPAERAAFVLREAFSYPYRDIAATLRVEVANARQLVTRARERLSGGRRTPVNPLEQHRLVDAFVHAAATGDLSKLEHLFSSDVVPSPNAARPPARPRRPVIDRERVSDFLAAVGSPFWSGVTATGAEATF